MTNGERVLDFLDDKNSSVNAIIKNYADKINKQY